MRILTFMSACVCLTSSALADPSDYSRVIAFGDSLSDNGNLYKNTGQPPSPPYYNGRFSNGPTWIELLSNAAKSTNPGSSMNSFWQTPVFSAPYDNGGTSYNVNAAIGGAQTVGGLLPSVQNQVAAFHASGGVFGPNDLVSVQGGANDFFNFFNAPPPPTQAQITSFAVQTGTNEASNVALAIGYGARTILVSNLPNIGATPNGITGGPLAEQGGLLATVVYNQTLNQATQQLAALNPAVNLVQMDWYSAFNVIRANPIAFGFTNVTQACVNSAACLASNGQGYLFWDGVHPTEAGHQLLARYASLLLSTDETGSAVGALGQFALSTRLDASDIIFRRGLAPFGQTPGGLYAEVIGQTASFNGTNFSTYGGTGFDYSIGGVRAGFDANSGPIAFGTAIAYQAGNLSGRALSSDLGTTQIDAYALSRLSVFFAGLEGGASFDEYSKIRRNTAFPTVIADGGTTSMDYSVAGTVGLEYTLGAFTITPAARVGYASINISDFTEAASILALQYGGQDITTGFWTARVRGTTPIFGTAAAYGEVGYEGLFSTDETYSAKLAFNTAHAVLINDNLEARGFFLKTGVGGFVAPNVQVTGEYELSTQNGAGDIHSGRLRVTIPLIGELPLKD
jgi:outer membrane lipase/esterase